MALELENLHGNLQNEGSRGIAMSIEAAKLKQIIVNCYDSILVVDQEGKVILVNKATTRLMGVEPELILGKRAADLIKQGVYDRSTSIEALQQRKVVTGMIRVNNGKTLISTSTPLMNSQGEITMVITSTRDKDIVDKYLEALNIANSTAKRYQNVVGYLSELDLEQKPIVADSPQMRKILATSGVIAKSDSSVMIFGETGSGKEVVARYIHSRSPRAKEPFIPVNCAAIPHELLESEFFGYVPGAFTGASSHGKAGLLEIADKGTLFLDEIGELPLTMQSKLLRILETGEFQRLGSTKLCHTDMRVVSATNRDLKAMMKEKTFRSDLYYRLNVIPINLPPLRERPEDICRLSYKFLGELNRKYGLKKQFSPQTRLAFLAYGWPGNVRELRNVIERLVVTTQEDVLRFEADTVPQSTESSQDTQKPQQHCRTYRGTLKEVLKSVEDEYINQVLMECEGKVGEAAEHLGIHRTMLYRKTREKVET